MGNPLPSGQLAMIPGGSVLWPNGELYSSCLHFVALRCIVLAVNAARSNPEQPPRGGGGDYQPCCLPCGMRALGFWSGDNAPLLSLPVPID
eukprot:13020035-Alexandrium_andersonii.AAC.1